MRSGDDNRENCRRHSGLNHEDGFEVNVEGGKACECHHERGHSEDTNGGGGDNCSATVTQRLPIGVVGDQRAAEKQSQRNRSDSKQMESRRD